MFDLMIRKANLPDGRDGVDIGIEGERIVAVGPALAGEAAEEIDAAGCLVTPPFVDAHFHMDSSRGPIDRAPCWRGSSCGAS
jgi:cytosine deaminase